MFRGCPWYAAMTALLFCSCLSDAMAETRTQCRCVATRVCECKLVCDCIADFCGMGQAPLPSFDMSPVVEKMHFVSMEDYPAEFVVQEFNTAPQAEQRQPAQYPNPPPVVHPNPPPLKHPVQVPQQAPQQVPQKQVQAPVGGYAACNQGGACNQMSCNQMQTYGYNGYGAYGDSGGLFGKLRPRNWLGKLRPRNWGRGRGAGGGC
jgi:hypothetical protein